MDGIGDRDSRFALDPREQIAAQRWARLRGLDVLGVCHSHPYTSPEPSIWDCDWAEPNRLMMILSGTRELRAWWLGTDRVPLEIPIEIWENHIHAAKSSHPTADSVL
jgi:proteasome lid subunit RPN8/RPN11